MSIFLYLIILFLIMINLNNTSKLVVGYVSFPNSEIAKKIAKILLTEKLAACVKVINNLESFYMWEGALQEDKEVYLMIKSKENRIADIKNVLDREHPYKVYEFLINEVKSVNEKYTEWVNSSLDQDKII